MDVNLKPVCEFQLWIPEEKKETNHVQHLDNMIHKFNLICSRLNNARNVKELSMTRESVHNKLSNVKADSKIICYNMIPTKIHRQKEKETMGDGKLESKH